MKMKLAFYADAKPFVQVVVLLLGWLLMTIVGTSLMVVASMAGLDIQDYDTLLWLQPLSQLVTFLLPACLFAWLFHGDATRYFHIDCSARQWGRGAVAVVMLLLLLPAIDWLTVWNDGWHLPDSLSSLEETMRSLGDQSEQLLRGMLTQGDGWHLLFNLVAIALCPAICEEIFFRGALQQALGRWFRNPHWAIIATATIFSLAHGELFAFVPRFALGLLLGYLFYLSGSMAVNVCVHFANNALIVVLYHLYANGQLAVDPESPLGIPLLWTLLTFLAAAALFMLYFKGGCSVIKKR